MDNHFYNDKKYREKQSAITKANWQKGFFDFMYRKDKRICARKGCGRKFEVIHSDPKVFCSQSCAALVNNSKRGPMSMAQKIKIAKALKGRKSKGFESPFKGKIKVARVKIICANPKCKKSFLIERWMKKRYWEYKNSPFEDVVRGKHQVVGANPTIGLEIDKFLINNIL